MSTIHTSEKRHEPGMGNRVLSRSLANQAYCLRLAENDDDLRAAQTLRFLVFNLELNEGLERSYVTCRDEDPFDAVCDHLLVETTVTREVVGTYRLQPGLRAANRLGFYSAAEFDFQPFESRFSQIIELGRACVHSAHRNLSVLGLLWKGIADYARRHEGRYLIGCSSLTGRDPAAGATAFAQLRGKHLAAPEWQTNPQPAFVCDLSQTLPGRVKIPKLLSAYLSFGASICGAPAIDREFGTIDFLTMLDLDTLSEITRRLTGA